MKKKDLLLQLLLIFSSSLFAQVGIGTVNPNASSVLDITATDKGILIPKVSLGNVANTMLDGTNTAATGLLIYNTNAATTGGSGVGYYYFNGTTWERLTTSATNTEDIDWYEEGTTTAPNAITDDIYTQGNVAIGKTTADYRLDISETAGTRAINASISGTIGGAIYGSYLSNSNTGTGVHYGSYNILSGTGTGNQYGTRQEINNSGNGFHYGSYNSLTGTGTGVHHGYYSKLSGTGSGLQFGFYNDIFNTGSGAHFGFYNQLSGTGTGDQYGTSQAISNSGSGIHYGSYNTLFGSGTGFQYGTRQEISNSGNGTHYGSFNQLSGTGSGDHYGSENLLFGSGTGAQYGTSQIISNSGNGLHYGSINQLSGSGSGVHYGSYNTLFGTGTGTQYGTRQDISNSGSGIHYGSYSQLSGAGSGLHYGSYNFLFGAGTGQQYGTLNNIQSVGSGSHYGTYNSLTGTASGQQVGSYQYISITGNSAQYASSNNIVSPTSSAGAKYASYNSISDVVGGTHYGVYSYTPGAGNYAGYFLGNVSIGATTANNYILPASRGTNNQIMQTDGSGNVSWVTPTSSSFWSRTGTNLDVANAGDDLVFGSQLTSITFPAASGTPAPMINMFASGTNNANRMVLAHSPLYTNYGLEYEDSNDIFRFLGNGNPIVEIDISGGGFPLRVYGTARALNFQSNTTTYPDYVFEKYFHKFSKINSAYTFKTLSEVENFIKKNGHLPNVKSYQEIEKQEMTINLAETSVTNLEKIEELFLYAIDADKKIVQLSKENNELKERLDAQQQEIDEIKVLLKKQ